MEKTMFECITRRQPIVTTPNVPKPLTTDNNYALIVGHNFKAKGATNYLGESEYDFNLRIAKLVQQIMLTRGYPITVITRPSGSYYHQCKAVAKKAKEHGINKALCLHFNSYNGSVQGVEALYLKQESRKTANTFCKKINKEYGIIIRGSNRLSSSHRGYGMLNELGRVGVDAIIIEPCFADNMKGSKMIFEDEKKYAEILTGVIIDE